MENYDLLTDRGNLGRAIWTASPCVQAPSEGIVVELQRFALTSNNFTYAKAGDSLKFWDFFLAPPGRGRMPVWGVGRVVASRSELIGEGEQIYGFFPISTYVALSPQARGSGAFVDVAAHRAPLPQTYNEYRRVSVNGMDDAFLVLRPLYSLGFFLAAYLKEQGYFGARQVLIASASSKTAATLAHEIGDDVETTGLTSGRNVASVAAAGFFNNVVAYSQVNSALEIRPSLLLDLSGDEDVAKAVRDRLGGALIKTLLAGATRAAKPSWPQRESRSDTELFFAPDHILRLREKWGAALLRDRLTLGLSNFIHRIKPWLNFQVLPGRREIQRTYGAVAEGSKAADVATILTDPMRE
jgi:Protein of unknown function (DUF2855)